MLLVRTWMLLTDPLGTTLPELVMSDWCDDTGLLAARYSVRRKDRYRELFGGMGNRRRMFSSPLSSEEK